MPDSAPVRRRLGSLALAVTLLALQLAPAAAAVRTDQEDYAPGSVVTIAGDNSNFVEGEGYLAGETVQVSVSGPNGYSASCEGEVGGEGSWSCQVTLWNSTLAVGTYFYTATGDTSGTSESGTFTDQAQVSITTVDFVWYTSDTFDVAVSGTYRCDGSSGPNGCDDADDVTVSVHEGDGSNNNATGTSIASKVVAVSTTGTNQPWSFTFEFRPAPSGSQFLTPADNKFDVQAVFHGKLGTSARTSVPFVIDNYFGRDHVGPTSAIGSVVAGTLPTASGTATDPGSDTPVEHFSGFDNSDNPNPVHVEIRTNPGGVLVVGSGQDLTLAGLGSTKQSGTWSYSYAGSPLTAGSGFCVLSRARDHATNVQAVATSSCFVVPGGDGLAPTEASIVINDADAWTDSPSVSVDIAGNDNIGVTRYRLAESQSGLDAAADVLVSPAEAVFSRLDLPFTLTGADSPSKAAWLRICDAANNCAEASDTIGLDTTDPTISISHTANGNGWNNSDPVTEAITASDGSGSGVYSVDCSDTLSGLSAVAGSEPNYTVAVNGEGIHGLSCTATDLAGNTGGPDTDTVRIDTTAPTAIAFGPTSITQGASYYYGFVPAGPTTCTANYDISGSAGCVVSGPDNGNQVGPNKYTATATDLAGNVGTFDLSYTVLAWTLQGFFQPVDMNGVYNTVKNGSTVPLKFRIFAGTTELTSVLAIEYVRYVTVPCDSSVPVDAVEEVATAGSTVLRYDGSQFIDNWKTPSGSSWVGKCVQVEMRADDGSSLYAFFKLK